MSFAQVKSGDWFLCLVSATELDMLQPGKFLPREGRDGFPNAGCLQLQEASVQKES